MPNLSPAEQQLTDWLREQLSEVPAKLNLLYLEWNETSAGAGKGKQPSVRFSLFGLKHDDLGSFDPEDDNDLELLSDPEWDAPAECRLPVAEIGEVEIDKLLKKVLKAAELKKLLGDRVVAFGEHEGDVARFPTKSKPASGSSAAADTLPYYELSPKPGGNFIESYEEGDLDETPLLDHDKVKSWPKTGVKLFMKRAPKGKDFLHFYRGWLVCTERAVKMFQEETDKIQVFPAPLFVQDKKGETPVPGYFVVVLYEKLGVIPDEYLIPSDDPDEAPEFHKGRGYKVKISATKGRQVFRLNCEYFRLLVTEKFRQRLESAGINSLRWLKRGSVP